MNVLLIHLYYSGKSFHIGLAYIASILKSRGHNIVFLSLDSLREQIILEKIREHKINVVFISSTTDSWQLCVKIVNFLNDKLNIPILLGGVHPTICPQQCIKVKGILGICIGEGELPAVELMDAMQNKEDYTRIKNLWIIKDEIVHKNEIRDLIDNLDQLPFPDYQMFSGQLRFEILPILLSRGCPFNCTYCCNFGFHVHHG